jgi:hypothetical protein
MLNDTMNSRHVGLGRVACAALLALALTAAGLGCSSGTPAAPEGTEIAVSYEYVEGTRNLTSGDFDAIIRALVLDSESDVPQVGVGVYFRVTGGPGAFTVVGPVETDEDGWAQSILVARGALSTNKVSIEVSSGPAVAELDIDVNGGFSSTNEPPEAAFTISPNPPRAGQVVTVDVGDSSDADCPNDEPETWEVDWGDSSTPDEGRFSSDTEATHTYASGSAGQSVTIRVTVEDCTGLTDSATRTVTLS